MKNLYLSLYLLFVLICSCTHQNSKNAKEQPEIINDAILEEGRLLAEKYCGNCHQFPKPDLLDKPTWRTYILPRMGYLMGIYEEERDKALEGVIEPGQEMQIIEAANIFPKTPLIEIEDWQKIKSYYLELSPDALTIPNIDQPDSSLSHFTVKKPNYFLSPPSTTLIHINEDQTFFIGDANKKTLLQFDSSLKLKNAANVNEGAVSIRDEAETLDLTVMGSFSPTDKASGFVLRLPKDKNSKPTILINNLQRPVHSDYGDLNQDGQEDIVICEFAKWTGGLSWWENQKGSYKKHILRNKPGAIKSYIQDFDQDGKLDIIALFGQGDEGIYLYTNQGEGKFVEKRLLQFPSSYGSSFFDLVDFNQDGHMDIVYTAGDNADYNPVTKPYHGLYIFLNDTQNQFKQHFFYPFPGAYKAIPADFDEDGDLDFAMISFFPDFQKSDFLSFVYLENKGDLNFEPTTFAESRAGRWISMDAGDVDGDQDVDIILGSLAFEVVPKNKILQQWVESGLPFIVLENTTK